MLTTAPAKLRGENPDLSPRESELRDLMFTSSDIANIAYQVGLTHGTVKQYSERLYRKLGVAGRVDLMSREIARLKGEK